MIENQMTIEELNKEKKPKAKYGNKKATLWICPDHHVFEVPENVSEEIPSICGHCEAPMIKVTFDSVAEEMRYYDLRFMLIHGTIKSLRIHPKYMIFKQFVDTDGKKIRPIFYEADFEYIENGVYVVEDVKGRETAVFKLKSKMFKFFCKESDKEYRFVIVPAKDYV